MILSFAEQMANPEEYLPAAPARRAAGGTASVSQPRQPIIPSVPQEFQTKLDNVINYIASQGFVFEPWQVAAFITAARTKPFVILAGISGTGKTKLPRLVAEATSSECLIVPVRPNWSDSSDLLGYERLDGRFYPGSLLRFAQKAQNEPEKQFFFVLDEMNIARVEYYLAEVLSHLEERKADNHGRFFSEPLMPHISQSSDGGQWDLVRLPDNLCIVGSVNMDETTYGFSKKVLDRAFVIEFSTVDLSAIGEVTDVHLPQIWSRNEWRMIASSLAAHPE